MNIEDLEILKELSEQTYFAETMERVRGAEKPDNIRT